jgi:aubergine-like protein
MFSQPQIKIWGIFYCARDEKIAKKFVDWIGKSIKTFNYSSISRPALFPVESTRYSDWETVLKKNLNPKVECVVLLLPGKKIGNPLYKDVKELLISQIPVPSQVVLNNTIDKGKNTISICNKILIQICAKVGGVPWTISDIPTVNDGTMICGLDVAESKDKKMSKIIGFLSSVDKGCTKYYSTAKVLEETDNFSTHFKAIITTAAEQYKKRTGAFPKNIVIYRDGVSDSQKEAVISYEIEPIKEAMKALGVEDIKIAVILVWKRINVKLFLPAGNSYKNPEPGTIVHSEITNGTTPEFYLISQKALQGTAVPTHYIMCYNNTSISLDEFHELTYKLCFTYFNVSGSIRVPSLVQYATRFSSLIEELSKKGKNKPNFKAVIPHSHLEKNIQSLFYI